MRYVKLDVDWDQSEWVYSLSVGSQLAWVKLLCHVKRSGIEGRVKKFHTFVMSRQWQIGEEDIVKMLRAAEQHGALRDEGEFWVITKWREYQSDSAERVRRWRERHKSDGDVTLRNVTQRNVTLVTTDNNNNSNSNKNTITPPKSPPNDAQGGDAEATASAESNTSLPNSHKKKAKQLVVPREFADPIKSAWRQIHLLPDGSDPLTETDYAILEKTIKQIFKQGIVLEEVLETIAELGELKKLSPAWAAAKPLTILANISAHRTGALKKQIAEYQKKQARVQEVQHGYEAQHDFRRK